MIRVGLGELIVVALIGRIVCCSDSIAAPPANDHFENRMDLGSASEISITAASAEATHELQEPDHLGMPADRSLWWKWTAASANRVEFLDDGSPQRIAIYEGDTLLSLNAIDSLERPKVGVTYSIALDVDPERDPDSQILTLRFRQQDDPLLQTGSFRDRIDGIPFRYEVSEPGTTVLHWKPQADGFVLIRSNTPNAIWIRREDSPIFAARPISLRDWTLDRIYYLEANSRFDYTFEFNWRPNQWSSSIAAHAIDVSMPAIPSNDRVENAIDLGNMKSVQGNGDNFRATSDPQEVISTGTNEPMVWWRWTAPEDGVFALESSAINFSHSIFIAEGASTETWTQVLRVDGIGGTRTDGQPVAFTAQEGSVYFFGFGSSHTDDRMGDIRFSLSRLPDAPHDLIKHAIDLGNEPNVESSQSLMRASTQEGEPKLVGIALYQRTVWWQWTAREEAFVWVSALPKLTLEGDVFAVNVFTDDGRGGQTPVHVSHSTGRTGFLANEGSIYSIGLTRGISPAASNGSVRPESLGTNVVLRIEAMAASRNDNYAERTDLGDEAHVEGSGHTYFASRELTDPVASPRTVWWSWKARYTGFANVKLTSPAPGVIADVFVGSGQTAEQPVSYWSDVGSAKGELTFWAEAGKSYQLCIGTMPEGEISFSIDLQDDPYTRAISMYPGMESKDYASDADPLNDGLSNLMRMAMGIDPRIPLTAGPNAGRSLAVTMTDDAPRVRCGFNPSFAMAGGIQFRLEFSLDGLVWFRLREAEVVGDMLEVRVAPQDIKSFGMILFRAKVEAFP